MAKEQRTPHWDRMRKSASEILTVRSEIDKEQGRPAAVVEAIGSMLAYPVFFVVFLSAHLLWILVNLPVFPWFEPWDPYPFVFLATFASAEAPFIALLILMYQRRSSRISELREEVSLQVALHHEQQMTVMLRQLGEVQEKLGIASNEDSTVLEHLHRDLDPKRLVQNLRENLKEDGEEATSP